MVIRRIMEDFSVCKVREADGIDASQAYCFIGKTPEECSLVCATATVPENALAREDGWTGFVIEGVLDFSLIGILAGISRALADAGIGIFVVSTFNTDYIFVKSENAGRATDALKGAGYVVEAGVN